MAEAGVTAIVCFLPHHGMEVTCHLQMTDHLVWARIVVGTLALELIHFLEPQTWIALSLSFFSGAHKFMCQQLEVKLKCANLIKLQLGACAPIKFEKKSNI